MSSEPVFQRVVIVGLGLIGSSLAHAIRRRWEQTTIIGFDISRDVMDRARKLDFCDDIIENPIAEVEKADLVLLCVPVGAMEEVGKIFGKHLKQGCVVSDTGSVKGSVVRALESHIPEGVIFIPAHPVAGTENSGPDAGFAELFEERWCIFTPLAETDESAVKKLREFWEGCGAKVVSMDAEHHDLVLAVTSHVPHLIAFGIVDTAINLEEVKKSEVIKFSGGGFRDFTRIAASDAVMWRDIFLHNREAVLEMLNRFSGDLDGLRKAIEGGDADSIEDAILRAQIIRHRILEAGEDTKEEDFGRRKQ
ncbi:MAG: prephenate/arogenate dehydrogenase family protein [Hyphomicrobiales bacterium]|nr:prephenate/arogenate dehydrogenase family protein [Hyphomicrobiales bacterium]MCY4052672.1 prephenate/arogenate dehydrogenase family protein [Hyphomicrobiales bacterium]